MQLSELDEDLKKLKSFARIQDKVTHKKDVLLPKWMPLVESYLAQVNNKETEAYDNPIFAYCAMWAFDIADFGVGLQLGFKAIELGQQSPNALRRNWPSFIADTIFDWSEVEAENGHSVEPYFSQVFAKVRGEWRLNEKIVAKFYKFAGLSLIRNTLGEIKASEVGDIEVLENADLLLEKAAQIHRSAQVKTIRNRIAMRIRALTEMKSQS